MSMGRHAGDGNIIDGYDWAAYRRAEGDAEPAMTAGPSGAPDANGREAQGYSRACAPEP
jgi:hypothetical protein